MDCAKIGRLISALRQEKNFTQQNVADALNISNKTVSKWECGLGCPDVSLWPELSAILGVDIKQMIEGEITPNKPDAGNVEKTRFYVCPSCSNVLTSTGSASIFCCGRKVEPLVPVELESYDDAPAIHVALIEDEYYVTVDHEMSRENYLLFAALVKSDKVHLIRLYPEQEAAMYLPYLPGSKLYLYSTQDGFTVRKVRPL